VARLELNGAPDPKESTGAAFIATKTGSQITDRNAVADPPNKAVPDTVTKSATTTYPEPLPPLAIAFLVGYAVDVFLSFLEGLLQAFTKTKSNTTLTASTPSSRGRD
jgi:hypothetical protein